MREQKMQVEVIAKEKADKQDEKIKKLLQEKEDKAVEKELLGQLGLQTFKKEQQIEHNKEIQKMEKIIK